MDDTRVDRVQRPRKELSDEIASKRRTRVVKGVLRHGQSCSQSESTSTMFHSTASRLSVGKKTGTLAMIFIPFAMVRPLPSVSVVVGATVAGKHPGLAARAESRIGNGLHRSVAWATGKQGRHALRRILGMV